VSKLKRLLCYESQHQSQSNEKSVVQFDYEKAVSNYLGAQSTFKKKRSLRVNDSQVSRVLVTAVAAAAESEAQGGTEPAAQDAIATEPAAPGETEPAAQDSVATEPAVQGASAPEPAAQGEIANESQGAVVSEPAEASATETVAQGAEPAAQDDGVTEPVAQDAVVTKGESASAELTVEMEPVNI